MNNLYKLNETNFNVQIGAIDFSDKIKILEFLDDFVSSAPFMFSIISKFIVKCIEIDPSYRDEILNIITTKSEDILENISRCIYGTALGISTNLPIKNIISDIFRDETLENISLKRFDNSLEVFCCFAILRNLSFYIPECIYRLKEFDIQIVIQALLIEESLFDISMASRLCAIEGFLETLNINIKKFKRKNEIIALIFISYYPSKLSNSLENKYICMKSHEDVEILRNMLDSEALDFCIKVANKRSLNKLLNLSFTDSVKPSISKETMLSSNHNNLEEFFNSFIKVSSPSVTHFLSYLEYFKDKFVLQEVDQIMFIKMLRDFHGEDASYLDIVLNKLVKFNIIKHELLL